MFKVGEKVVGASWDNNNIIANQVGTVISIEEDDETVLVAFDKPVTLEGVIVGHTGNGSIPDGYGWYVYNKDLLLYDGDDGDYDGDDFDPVNKPSHYADKLIEVIDYIKDTLTPEQYEGYAIGNVIKYISRYQKKGGVQDLQKANYYLMEAICVLKEK